MIITNDTRNLIDEALRSELSEWNYVGFDAEPRPDSDGDPAIFVTARFSQEGVLPPSAATIRAMVAISDRLRTVGDDRIPYLDYVYPPDPISGEAA